MWHVYMLHAFVLFAFRPSLSIKGYQDGEWELREGIALEYGQVDTPGKTLGFWHEIKIHPSRPEWVLAKVRRLVCEQWDSSTNPWCAFDLFYSQVSLNATALSKGHSPPSACTEVKPPGAHGQLCRNQPT